MEKTAESWYASNSDCLLSLSYTLKYSWMNLRTIPSAPAVFTYLDMDSGKSVEVFSSSSSKSIMGGNSFPSRIFNVGLNIFLMASV